MLSSLSRLRGRVPEQSEGGWGFGITSGFAPSPTLPRKRERERTESAV
jgi:hypothetical protein